MGSKDKVKVWVHGTSQQGVCSSRPTTFFHTQMCSWECRIQSIDIYSWTFEVIFGLLQLDLIHVVETPFSKILFYEEHLPFWVSTILTIWCSTASVPEYFLTIFVNDRSDNECFILICWISKPLVLSSVIQCSTFQNTWAVAQSDPFHSMQHAQM